MAKKKLALAVVEDTSVLKEEDYLKKGGLYCPYCGSEDIEPIDSIDIDGPNASQEIACNNCEEEWEDLFKLVGVREI